MKKYVVIGFILFAAAIFYLSRLEPAAHLSRDSSSEKEVDQDVTARRSGWASSASDRALNRTHDLSRTTASAGASRITSVTTSVPLTEASGLERLQSESRQGWDLRRADFSEQIRTLVHGQWQAPGAGTPREASDSFIKTYSQALFGIDPARVHFDREEVTDRTRMTYQEVVNGTPVYGSTINLFFDNGTLTRVQNDMAVGEPTLTESPKDFSLAQAFERYKSSSGDQSGAAAISFAKDIPTRTILYPSGHSLIYAYEFSTNETASGDSFRVIYDAENPHVIKRRSTHIH